MVLVLGSDLFFASRIAEVARTLGVACARAGDVAALLAQATGAASPPRLIFVDLLARGVDPVDALVRLRAEPATAGARVVAFFPHVEEELGAAARRAGADAVLTRGQLTKQLPALIGELVAPPA